jgi:peptide/nickel transport system ATP-binding protein
MYILEGKNVTVKFKRRNEEFIALNGVSLGVDENEYIVVLGESGAGKSTLSLVLAGIIRPSSGEVLYLGKNIYKLNKKEFRMFRREVQYIMQNPYSGFNPYKTIYKSLKDVIDQHKLSKDKQEIKELIENNLELVNLDKSVLYKYPHQLSGGQLQRVAIARTLLLKPKVIIADEIVSMLDASLKISVIDVFKEICNKYSIASIFITHDIGSAKYFSGDNGTILIMYKGEIIEKGRAKQIIYSSSNPYTKKLIESYIDIFEDR